MSVRILEPIFWLFMRRFFGGKNFEQAFARARILRAQGFGVLLNCVDHEYLGVTQSADTRRDIERQYFMILNKTAEANLKRIAPSIKLSQFGIQGDPKTATRHVLKLVTRAAALKTSVEFDMEHAADIDTTLDIVLKARKINPFVRCTIQACHWRSMDDMKMLVKEGVRVRWCEGAYDEGMSSGMRYQVRVLGAEYLLARGVDPAFAVVRNERFVKELIPLAARIKKPLHLQMLYGFRPAWQSILRAGVARVDVYVPYGKEWSPYGFRRAEFFKKMYAENPFAFPRELYKVYFG